MKAKIFVFSGSREKPDGYNYVIPYSDLPQLETHCRHAIKVDGVFEVNAYDTDMRNLLFNFYKSPKQKGGKNEGNKLV